MKFLIASMVGAVIGYFTNWLAIKMLFRPYEEKKFMGFTLPFTPGLIPKEKSRIAKSVGETVGTHLLSNEVLVGALCSEKMQGQIKLWIDRKVEEIKGGDTTIKEQLKNLTGENYSNLIKAVKEQCNGMVLESVMKEDTRKRMRTAIEGLLVKEFQRNMDSVLQWDFIKSIREKVLVNIINYRDSNKFKEEMYEYIQDQSKKLYTEERTLEEVLPASALSSIETYIYNSREEISNSIREMLGQPEVEEQIKEAVSSMINTNFNPMIAMFIKVDTIYEKLIGALDEYLKEEEGQKNTALLVSRALEKITKNSIKDIVSNIGEKDKEDNIKAISSFVVSFLLSDNMVNVVFKNVDEKIREFKNIHFLLEYFEKDYLVLISGFLSDKIEKTFNSQEFKNGVGLIIENSIEAILDKPSKELVLNKEEKVKEFIVEVIEGVYRNFIEKEATGVVENLNVPQIVEERINSFDTAFAEKIILDIASKELGAITWLGAFLGGIIGLLSPILGYFY